MMNKIKSGIFAKLKALIAIPIILAVFLFFTDFTLDKTALSNKTESVSGLWKTDNLTDSQVQLLKIENQKLTSMKAIGNNNLIIDNYELMLTRKWLKISSDKANMKLKYKLDTDKLNVWWTENEVTQYSKIPENTSYKLVGSDFAIINRPKAQNYQVIDPASIDFRLTFDTKCLYINDKKEEFSNLSANVKNELEKLQGSDNRMATLDINAESSMKDVSIILQHLRENSLLKIAYLVEPADTVAIPGKDYGLKQLLPPPDAQLLDLKEVKESGMEFYKIDVSGDIPNRAKVKSDLKSMFTSSEKYVMQMIYSDKTFYKTFITYTDLVYTSIKEIRDEYAIKTYQKQFDSLDEEVQKEIRTKFPITLTTLKE